MLQSTSNGIVKLALLSDIHANLQAFDACVADANAREATQFALLGDFVGYGADPRAIVQRVMAMVTRVRGRSKAIMTKWHAIRSH